MRVENHKRLWEMLCPGADTVLGEVADQYGGCYIPQSRLDVRKVLDIPVPYFSLVLALTKLGRYWKKGSQLGIRVILHHQKEEVDVSLATPVLADTLRTTLGDLLGQVNLPRELPQS